MRILIINFEYPPLGGGGGVATQQIAEELAQRHEVHVITSRFGELVAEEELMGVRLHRVPVLGRTELSAASFVSLLAFVPTALWRGWRLCRELKFDVINAQFVLPSGVVAVGLAKMFQVPLVVSFIGGDIYDPTKGTSPHRFVILRGLIRWIARKAKALTAISEDTKRRAQEMHGVEGDISVVPVGFTPREIETCSRKSLGLPEGKQMIISVGRLIARKRFERLIESLEELPEAFLVIVGEGWLRKQLEEQVRAWGLDNRVVFTGFVSEEKKCQLLAAADVYVSAAEHEGFGIVFLEAMAAGLPIVAVRNGGQEDFLREGHNALLVPASEPKDLAAATARLLADPQLREKMKSVNTQEVLEYTAENVARKFERVLMAVIEKPI